LSWHLHPFSCYLTTHYFRWSWYTSFLSFGHCCSFYNDSQRWINQENRTEKPSFAYRKQIRLNKNLVHNKNSLLVVRTSEELTLERTHGDVSFKCKDYSLKRRDTCIIL
jgi:hypothetical protein